MQSIRARLVVILLIATGLVWLSAVLWIFLSTRAEVERVLDARLMEAGRMVNSLLISQDVRISDTQNTPVAAPAQIHTQYDRQLSCQIWSLQGVLIGRSGSAPDRALSDNANGISEKVIDGETWRVFAVENAALGVRVLVGDNLSMRQRLVNDVIKGLLLPALLIMPISAGLIWLSVTRGLRPLSGIAGELATRKASDLSPLASKATAKEVAPVLRSLNGLFARVAEIRNRERNFTAFAAHELRTPLAGLKTQAQVALASDDRAIREQALRQIVVGVDRTGRLVGQLLDISAIDASESMDAGGCFHPAEILASIRSDLRAANRPNARIAIDPELETIRVAANADLFRLAARNLMENAINHSPQDGRIVCSARRDMRQLTILVEDDGPGIPDDELPQVTERFFRGRNKTPIGSGLGLAIAALSLEHIGCTLSLRNRPGCGLAAGIGIPMDLVISGLGHDPSEAMPGSTGTCNG